VLGASAATVLARPSTAQGEVPVAIPRASAASTDEEQPAINRKYLAVVRKEIERAKGAKSPREVIIYARTSFGYGCDCMPFLFDPIRYSSEDGFWPRYSSAVQPMPWGPHGPFRLTGHFEPDLKTGYQVWGPLAPAAGDEDVSAVKAPVFAVSAWCWELADGEVPDVSSWQIDDVQSMIEHKNVCASAAQIKSLKRNLQRAKSRKRRES
jgi:hypothetical protein